LKKNKNLIYLKKVQRYKRLSQPVINILDKLRILPLAIPFLNWILRKMKVKRQFQKDLNYRLIGKAFKGVIQPYNKKKDKTILVPFFTSGNNIFLLLNFLITKRLQKRGYQSIFLICDKSLPICNNERINKTREDDKFLCSSCYGTYPFLSKITGAKFLKLSDYSNPSNYKSTEEEINQIASLEACRSFRYNGNPIGLLAEKSVMRFFLTGELEDKEEHINSYKKFLKSLLFFIDTWDNLLQSENVNPELVLLYNGTLSFETYVRNYCASNKIDYVTNETYVGNNSWIYKKNDEVMKLNWDEFWNEFKSSPFTESQRNRSIEFIEGLRGGKQMYAKLNEKTPLDDRLIGKEFIVLFTNLNFDTAVLGRNPVFNSMQDWIDQVIDYWIENEVKTKLVIRVHPAELKLITASGDFVGPKIKSKIKGVENIVLFDASDKVDSYTLIENMTLGLIYSSTIGMEIAYMGKPCLVAGDAFYKEKPFIIYESSVKSYFEKLNILVTESNYTAPRKEDVLKFIDFIYFNRVKRLKGIGMDHANHVNTFTFENAEELEEMNATLLDEFEIEVLS